MRAIVINKPLTRASVLDTARALRQVADTLERNGQQAYVGGGLCIDHRIERAYVSYDECERGVGPGIVTVNELSIHSDLVLCGNVHAPFGGLRPVQFRGDWYMWDGEPARTIRKGEVYENGAVINAQFALRVAESNLKKIRFVYTPC